MACSCFRPDQLAGKLNERTLDGGCKLQNSLQDSARTVGHVSTYHVHLYEQLGMHDDSQSSDAFVAAVTLHSWPLARASFQVSAKCFSPVCLLQ